MLDTFEATRGLLREAVEKRQGSVKKCGLLDVQDKLRDGLSTDGNYNSKSEKQKKDISIWIYAKKGVRKLSQ